MEIRTGDGGVYIPAPGTKVKITETGWQTRIQFLRHRTDECPILVLPGNQYVNKATGEVLQRQRKAETRADNLQYVRRSMQTIRDLVNTNVTDLGRVSWVTFTYAENMTDNKKLMNDWHNFNKFYRRIVGQYEYIAVVEPQGRGAWHLHVFMIFDVPTYIDYNVIRKIWGKGRVEVQQMYGDVDNVGAYLSAYLCNLDLHELAESAGNKHNLNIVELEQHDGTTKSFIKGMRLSMYPRGMRIYRKSKGIKNGVSEVIRLDEAEKKVSSGKLTFKKLASIERETYTNLCYTEYYNLKPADCQEETN